MENSICGTVHKLKDGFFINCTLCELVYKCFKEYSVHVEENHFSTIDVDSGGVLEEDEHPISQLVKSEVAVDDQFDTSNTEDSLVSMTVTIERNDQNNENSEIECRPVRKKTMYFQPPDEIRKFKCSICSNSSFKDSASLRQHVIRHTTKKSHQCPQCQKKFYTTTDLKIHQRSHSQERLVLCPLCGKTCLSNTKLKDHMRRHTNQRDYKCTECEKCFFNSSLLTKHKAVHSSDRPFKCKICEAKFAYGKGLRNHMKLHENKREYKCEFCPAAFNQQAGLFCHFQNKHKRA